MYHSIVVAFILAYFASLYASLGPVSISFFAIYTHSTYHALHANASYFKCYVDDKPVIFVVIIGHNWSNADVSLRAYCFMQSF